MLQSELYAVAAMPSPAVLRLPRHVVPGKDEALGSWVARLAFSHGLSPVAFCRDALGVDAGADPEWWRRPSPETLDAITRWTGLGTDQVRAMTFLSWREGGDDEQAQRFAAEHWDAKQPDDRRGRLVDICPLCVGEGHYLRQLWLIGWAGVCPRHGVILTGWCPSCLCVLRVPHLSAKRPADPVACRRCGAALAGTRVSLAHPAALRLQRRLLRGKRHGVVRLPSGAMMAWDVAVALADELLGLVWTAPATEGRQRLYDRIASDLGIDALARLDVPWSTNYGGLLMLSWFLDDLDARRRAAAAILRAPPSLDESQLTTDQAEILGQWIADERFRQGRDMVEGAARAMFGIALHPDRAATLLRTHRYNKAGRWRRSAPRAGAVESRNY